MEKVTTSMSMADSLVWTVWMIGLVLAMHIAADQVVVSVESAAQTCADAAQTAP